MSLNLINAIAACIYLDSDKNFQKVLKKDCSIVFVLMLSVLLTFKWFVFLTSAFCDISSLKIKLSKSAYITALKVLFFTSVLALGGFIGSSILYILTLNYYFTFLFFEAVELMALATLEILLTFMSMSTMNKMVGQMIMSEYEESNVNDLPD